MKKKLLPLLLFASSLFIGKNLSAQVYTAAPYYDGFETDSLHPEWTTSSSLAGGEVATFLTGTMTWTNQTANSHSGNYFLGMHHATGGSYNLNTANLHLDMNGNSNMRFSFWWAEWNDETEPEDGVFISDDGGINYVKVLDLEGTSQVDLQYKLFDMSLDSINTVHGLSFTSTYVIRIQQYDNFYFAGGNDGFLIDDVSVYPACNSFSTISPIVCSSYITPSGNETYTTSGIYTDTIPNTVGCDSIITIDLTVNNNTSSTISPIVCASYTTPSGNETYTASGIYTDTIPNTLGCDSIIIINLTVNSTSSTISPIVCASYTTPSGNETYTTSGIYSDTISNTAGCDSIITINLSVNNTSSTIIENVIDTYTAPSGAVYNTTGIYTDTIPNAVGCDSIITIDLTVGYTGIDNQNIGSYNIYPNPVVDLVNIEFSKLTTDLIISVMDLTGKVIIANIPVNQTNVQVDVSHFKSGIYFINISNANKTETIKLLVQ